MYNGMGSDFHLLKRTTKSGKKVFYAAFLSDVPGKNGKRKYTTVKSTGVGSRPAAEKITREMLGEGKVFAAKDSLREYLLNFWDADKSEYLRSQRAEGKSHNSIYLQNNRQRIEQYVLPYFENRGINRLSDLDRRNILAWRNYLYEHGKIPEYVPPEPVPGESRRGKAKRPATISPATQNKVRQAFFVALQWAVDMGMLPYHPGQGIKRVREERNERAIFEIPELVKLFSAPWPDIRAFAACMLAATTGARLGEVRGLKVSNTHIDQGYIDIVTNFVEGDGLKEPKWNSKRFGVPIPEATCNALMAVLRASPFAADPNSYVFYAPSSRHRPMDMKIIVDGLQNRMKEIEINGGRTFHSFRHTYVSHLRGTVPESKLLRLVGHTNTAMSDRYTHASDTDRDAVKTAVSRMLESPEDK